MINNDVKRIYRSRDDKVVAGVCGGLGKYLGLDPVLIRVLWLGTFLIYCTGLVLYIIAALIIPEEN